MDGTEFASGGLREEPAIGARPTVPLTAAYLPEARIAPQLAPATSQPIAIVTSSSRMDYSESWAGFRLDPERVAWIFRQADWGMPLQMYDMFEAVTLTDGHLRGLFEQRCDEVASVPRTWLPGDDRAASIKAAQDLDGAMQAVDMEALVEHLMLAWAYGASYAELAWQTRGDGLQVPVEVVCVPHRRFMFDPETFEARLTSETNPYPGDRLERRAGSSWIKAETKRWRKQTQAGLLRTATYWAVFKRMSVRDWLIFAAKYGIPMIAGKYGENSSEATRKALQSAIDLLGTEGRALLAHDATIEIYDHALRSGGGDHLHAGITQLCNSEISKCITAGTLTSDTGGPGSFALGQVHADQKHKLSLADARRVGAWCRRWIGAEFLARNRIANAAPPWLHCHVVKLSLLTDSQVLTNLVGAGVPISISQVREKFEYRPPSSPDDTLKPPVPNGKASNSDPADPREPADPARG